MKSLEVVSMLKDGSAGLERLLAAEDKIELGIEAVVLFEGVDVALP